MNKIHEIENKNKFSSFVHKRDMVIRLHKPEITRQKQWGGCGFYLEAAHKEWRTRRKRRESAERMTSRVTAGEEVGDQHFHHQHQHQCCCFRYYSRADSCRGRQSGTVRQMTRRQQQLRPTLPPILAPIRATTLVCWH
jgi:hypothetical protein